ncbi:serine-type endopeptidase inhibitor activity [Sparganum proliferum]
MGIRSICHTLPSYSSSSSSSSLLPPPSFTSSSSSFSYSSSLPPSSSSPSCTWAWCQDRVEKTGVEGRLDPCLMPIKSGMCRARIPMYAFNAQLGVCEEFIYGGCGGNLNRFETLEDCEMSCGGRHGLPRWGPPGSV